MRSLNFSPQERNLLLKYAKEEQNFIFTRENTKEAIQLKRQAWERITEAFNKNSPQKRSTMTLQNKFCKLKHDVKQRYFKKYLSNKKHEKLVEAEDIKAEPDFESKPMSDEEFEENNGDDSGDNDEDLSDIPLDVKKTAEAPDPIKTSYGRENNLRRNRSLNFLPYEVSLLLKCVKQEHKYILSKHNTTKAVIERNKAWTRVTEAFNKKARQGRSTRILKTKFANLKKNMRPGRGYFNRCPKSNRNEKLIEETSKNIKSEPRLGYESDSNDNQDDEDDDESINEVLRPDSSSNQSPELAPDPLSTVLSSDSGLGSTSFIGAYNFGNSEVTKLKLELLKYQMENAKLERQRLEEAMRAEAASRESLAIERSLRLRAARLEAVAAEMKLPASHHALQHTFEEAPAQQYMNQFNP